MFLPAIYAEERIPTLRKLIRENPLGIITTAIPSSAYPLIQTSHIPFVLDVQDESNETELGVLRGHIARQNPQAQAMIESLESLPQGNASYLEQEVLVLFNSPIHHYVTPKFYTETKPDTGKVVPTWDYATAQAYGRAKIYYDSKSDEAKAFLSQQLDDLTRYAETSIMGYTGVDKPGPWKVSDAPERYIDLLRKNIIGIEISIDRLEGKFKMSQERGLGDRKGVIQGFAGLPGEIGAQMSGLVKERGELKDSKSS